MKRKLKDITTKEVTLTDLPATRKKFLFFKKDLGEGAGIGGPRQGLGGAKYCVCPKCGYSVEHKKIGEGKSKPCASIKCPECGEKMAGSKTKELSKLKKAHISIDSDGTVKGTKVLVDGEEIKDMADFSFSFYMPRSGEIIEKEPRLISCSYSKVTETEDGFKHTDHFYLSKGEVNEVDKEFKELYKEVFEEDFPSEEDFEKAKMSDKALNAIKGALKLVSKYKGDFPDDLKDAVKVLTKYAGYGYGYPKKKEDLEKAGAKLSKSTVEKIINVIKALNDLLPDENKVKVKKEAVIKDEALRGEFEKIHKALEKLEKGDGDKNKDKDKGEDPLKDIQKRIETLEKAKGIKKSLDDNGEKGKDKGEFEWGLGKILDGDEE